MVDGGTGTPALGGHRAYKRCEGTDGVRPIEASKAAVGYVRNTSIPAIASLRFRSGGPKRAASPLRAWHVNFGPVSLLSVLAASMTATSRAR